MRPSDASATPRDQEVLRILDGLSIIERRELRAYAMDGPLPRLNILHRLIALGLMRRSRDGWELGEGVTRWHIGRLALPPAISDGTAPDVGGPRRRRKLEIAEQVFDLGPASHPDVLVDEEDAGLWPEWPEGEGNG